MSSSMAAKRMLRDRKLVMTKQKADLEAQDIYVIPDETKINIVRILIIGPERSHNPFSGKEEETPYFGGLYTFNVVFPDTYPFEPMKVDFMTQNRHWRCHPNYYTNGKVCLSSLNTWGSNEWSPERTLGELCFILRARLDAAPLRYEPGYETADSSRIQKYNMSVKYGNYKFGILQMYNNLPESFKDFTEIINKRFLENYCLIEKQLLEDKHTSQ